MGPCALSLAHAHAYVRARWRTRGAHVRETLVRRALALQLDATVGEPGRYLSYVGLGDETVPC